LIAGAPKEEKDLRRVPAVDRAGRVRGKVRRAARLDRKQEKEAACSLRDGHLLWWEVSSSSNVLRDWREIL